MPCVLEICLQNGELELRHNIGLNRSFRLLSRESSSGCPFRETQTARSATPSLQNDEFSLLPAKGDACPQFISLFSLPCPSYNIDRGMKFAFYVSGHGYGVSVGNCRSFLVPLDPHLA